jgi:tetratricopeptide (TPR) repeat protein
MIGKKILYSLFFFASTLFVAAHGDLTKRINIKTSEIKLNPNNPELYFDRGFLYQQHEEYDKAVSDYLKAEDLGFNDKLLDFRKAETYYKWGKYKLALTASSAYLVKDNIDVKINKLHAQILFELKHFDKAFEHYKFFIDTVEDPRPEDYIEFSLISIANYNDYNKAIEILENGIQKLGNVISLQLEKLEYYKKSNQVEKAIEQYNQFILNNKRNEFWYYKKANYLFENNQIAQCKIALEQSKVSISILKDRIKNTQAIKNLIKNINNLEKQLNHE